MPAQVSDSMQTKQSGSEESRQLVTSSVASEAVAVPAAGAG